MVHDLHTGVFIPDHTSEFGVGILWSGGILGHLLHSIGGPPIKGSCIDMALGVDISEACFSSRLGRYGTRVMVDE